MCYFVLCLLVSGILEFHCDWWGGWQSRGGGEHAMLEGLLFMRVIWYATRAGGMHVHIADPTQHRLHRYRSLATLTRADIGLGSVGTPTK